MSDYGGLPERNSRWWRVFTPLAWILVRIPGLRMALSVQGLNEALARAERAYRIAERSET